MVIVIAIDLLIFAFHLRRVRRTLGEQNKRLDKLQSRLDQYERGHGQV